VGGGGGDSSVRKVCEKGGSWGGVEGTIDFEGTNGLVGEVVRDRMESEEGDIGRLRAAERASWDFDLSFARRRSCVDERP